MNKLDNYLRTHRRRTGLSQSEVAAVLGCKDGGQVSRHERLVRTPALERALAYEALYHASVRELFAGLYEKVERGTFRRAWTLAVRLDRQPPSTVRDGKLAWIRTNCTRDRSPRKKA